jgi:hypothetical protein
MIIPTTAMSAPGMFGAKRLQPMISASTMSETSTVGMLVCGSCWMSVMSFCTVPPPPPGSPSMPAIWPMAT